MIAGLPGMGLSAMFYAVLLLGMGAATLWRRAVRALAGSASDRRRNGSRPLPGLLPSPLGSDD